MTMRSGPPTTCVARVAAGGHAAQTKAANPLRQKQRITRTDELTAATRHTAAHTEGISAAGVTGGLGVGSKHNFGSVDKSMEMGEKKEVRPSRFSTGLR